MVRLHNVRSDEQPPHTPVCRGLGYVVAYVRLRSAPIFAAARDGQRCVFLWSATVGRRTRFTLRTRREIECVERGCQTRQPIIDRRDVVRARLFAYAAIVGASCIPARVAGAQASARPGDSVFVYVGYSSGMRADDALALVRRRDGQPIDRSWCKPTTMRRTPTQLTCSLTPVWLARSGLPVSVTFGLADSTAAVDYVGVTRTLRDSASAAEELERVAALWELSGRKVLRAGGSGPYGQLCGRMAWIDDRDFRAHATTGCGMYGGIPGDPPRFHVDFYYP